MSETISPEISFFEQGTLRSAVVKIGKGAANAPSNDTVIPAGYILLESSVNGQEYDVFSKTGIAANIVDTLGTAGTSVTTPKKAVAVLLEPWKVSATQTNCKVAIAGEFFIDGIYARCGETLLPEATVTKKMLRNAAGHCVFVDREGQKVWG